MADLLKVACVQANVHFGEPMHNADVARAHLEELAGQGVGLAVFPEAFLTGYVMGSREEALAAAIPAESEVIGYLKSVADRFDIAAVIGFAEQDAQQNLFNSAVILEPGLPPRYYRKTHLPFLGLDRYCTHGNALEVFEMSFGKMGVLVCFDMRYPEATRTLVLKGADLIVLPTNWPEGAEVSADTICIARAAENGVYFVTCNRAGAEKGYRFLGRSKVIGPGGNVIVSADSGEAVLIAELDLALSRIKRRIVIEGQYETELIAERRPELYGPITSTDLG